MRRLTAPSRIAIDGPAASGKSTLAQRLAARLGYLFLDTGVMYRAVTLAALRKRVPVESEAAVSDLARAVSVDVRSPSAADGRQCDVLLDGEDVTWQIRSPEVDANVSQVSLYPGVRAAMGERQREIGARGQVVMVGRDIGTVILPEAELKIYLDASAEARAQRRHAEITARGELADYQEILASMRERDRIDSTRTLAPLRPAGDAIVVDSTHLSIDQVVERANGLVAARRDGEVEAPVRIPWSVRAFRAVARPLFRMLFHILCSIRIEGRQNVPSGGGYLVSSNHLSIIDPPFVVAFWPRPLETAGAVEILERPFQGQLMRWYGGIPVHRGEIDRELLNELVRRLKAGYPVMMDPEGRRSHSAGMQDARPGVAYIAARAGVPVVPVGITGAEAAAQAWRRFRRGRLIMKIGKPVVLPAVDLRSPSRKAALRANTDRLMHAIAELLPEAYRGIYA